MPRQPGRQGAPADRQAGAAPEMHPWTAEQLAAFLAWAREHSQLHAAWHVLAYHRDAPRRAAGAALA